ncbi:MAG: L,D-transpeptidase [Solirubrobacteraceae bacterium]|nr:MAG: hypothetical protein DLM63_12460 [Solirubrobacterales bacterium]
MSSTTKTSAKGVRGDDDDGTQGRAAAIAVPEPAWDVDVERFESVAVSDTLVLLRIRGWLIAPEPDAIAAPRMVVAVGGERHELRPVYPRVELKVGPERRCWIDAFSAPRDLVTQASAELFLEGAGFESVLLPVPLEREAQRQPSKRSAGEVSAELLARGQAVVGRMLTGGLPRAVGRVLTLERAQTALRRVLTLERAQTALRRVFTLGPAQRVLLQVVTVTGVALIAWQSFALVRGGARQSQTRTHSAAVATGTPAGHSRVRPAAASLVPPPGTVLVAHARRRRVAIYGSRTGGHPRMILANPDAQGIPVVFTVAATASARLHVRLPTRPNNSTGWIARSAASLTLDPYRIDVHLRRHVLILWRRGLRVAQYPIGVGVAALTPTPPGVYYITELLKQPDPSGIYGPYAFGLSAHSSVLHEFAGGDGRIGLHGTNQPWLVGRDVSHGCIRVRNAVIRRLAEILPLGTPVQISR